MDPYNKKRPFICPENRLKVFVVKNYPSSKTEHTVVLYPSLVVLKLKRAME